MKKSYELLQVNVISLDNDDVITASGKKSINDIFDFGKIDDQSLNVQIF